MRNQEVDKVLSSHGFVPIAEAATWSGRNYSTIYRWLQKGLIKGKTSGNGAIWVCLDDVRTVASVKTISPKL